MIESETAGVLATRLIFGADRDILIERNMNVSERFWELPIEFETAGHSANRLTLVHSGTSYSSAARRLLRRFGGS